MRKFIFLCVVLVLFGAGVAHGASSAAEQLPAGVVAFVEVPDVFALDGELALLVGAVVPEMPWESLAKTMPRKLLQTTDPTTVELSKPVQLLVLAPPLHEEPVVVFHLADPQRYLDSLLPELAKRGEQGGVALYGEPPPETGVETTPPQPAGEQVAIAVVGTRAALGERAEAVAAVRAMLEAGTLADETFAGAHLGGIARPRALLEAMAAEGADPFEQLRQQMAAPLSIGPGGQEALRVFQAVLDDVEDALRQVETVGGTLTFEGDAIAGWMRATVTPDGGLAAYLGSVPEGELDLLKWLPAASSVALATKVGDLGPLTRRYAELVRELAPEAGEGGEVPLTGLPALAESMAAVMGGEVANAWRVDTGVFQVTSAAKVTDAAKARELMGEMAELMPAMQQLQEGAGVFTDVTFTPEVETYKGVPIGKWATAYEFQVPGDTPTTEQVAAVQRAMIDAVWGGSMDAYQAFLDDTMLYVQGAGALEAVRAAIGGETDPLVGSERLASALEGLPADPVAVGFVSLEEMLQFYLRAVSTAMMQAGQFMPPFLASMRFEVGPPVAYGAWITEDGTVEKRIRVPVESITNIADGFRQAMMPMMPPPQQQWGEEDWDSWEDAEEQLPQSEAPAE